MNDFNQTSIKRSYTQSMLNQFIVDGISYKENQDYQSSLDHIPVEFLKSIPPLWRT